MNKQSGLPPKAAGTKSWPQPPAASMPEPVPPVFEDEVFTEDFRDVESGPGFVIPEGTYHAKVVEFEKSDSRSGNPQYVWRFRILAGEHKDAELRYWTSLLPQARWKVVETLLAVGIKAAGSIVQFKRSDIVGKPCVIEIAQDTFEGQATSKVRKVYPPNAETLGVLKADSDEIPF